MKKGYKNLIAVGMISTFILAGCSGNAGAGGGSAKQTEAAVTVETESVAESAEAESEETSTEIENIEGSETEEKGLDTAETDKADTSVSNKAYSKGDTVSSTSELPSEYMDVDAINEILKGIFNGRYDDEIVWDENGSGKGVLAAAYDMAMHSTNRMFFYTDDGGQSWMISDDLGGSKYLETGKMNGSNLVMLAALKYGCSGSAYVSFDGGKTIKECDIEKIMFEDITNRLMDPPNTYPKIVSLDSDGKLVVDWYLEKSEGSDVLMMKKTYMLDETADMPLKKDAVERVDETALGVFYLYCKVNSMGNNGTDDIGLFPNSSKEYLTTDDVEKVLASVNVNYATERMAVQAAINEIYARKGYDFTGTGYDIYCDYIASNRKASSSDSFGKLSLSSVKDSDFTEVEKRNIDLLAAYRNRKH